MGCSNAGDDNGMMTMFPVAMGTSGVPGLPMAGGTPVVTSSAGTGGVVAMPTGGMIAPVGGMMAPSGGMMAPSGGMGGSTPSGGSGGSGGSTPSGGSGGMPEGGSDGHMDQGMGDGTDVITIGDSYMNLGTIGIEQSLERISGRNYRNYAVAGTRVLDEAIPNQYDRAKAADPNIKTVVMTAGGNDVIMTSECGSSLDSNCQMYVDSIQTRIWELHDEMAADGVQDVIYIGYGYTTGVWAYTKMTADYARMQLIMDCTTDRMPRCHYIDPINELMGQIGLDGIHPTSTGYDRLGQLAWDRMQAEGVRR